MQFEEAEIVCLFEIKIQKEPQISECYEYALKYALKFDCFFPCNITPFVWENCRIIREKLGK